MIKKRQNWDLAVGNSMSNQRVIVLAGKLAFWGTCFIGVGLIGIGLLTFLSPGFSSQNYGIKTEGATDGWVMASGIRDIVLGVFLIVLSADKVRLPFLLGVLMLVPVADVVLSNIYGDGMMSTIPHALGAVVIFVVFVCSLKQVR